MRGALFLPGRLPAERIGTQTSRIGTEEHFRWLGQLVHGILILNVIDAGLTLLWVYNGLATEANPLMEDLVHNHPVRFVLVKFALVLLGSTLLWRFRKRAFSVVGIFAAFLIYYYVLIYHLSAANLRLVRRFWD